MAGSPLGLSAENPVTSARIKCTHALGRFPTWNGFQTKTRGPVTEPRAGPKHTRGRESPKTPFCLPGSRKENNPGDGGGRDPSGRGNGKEQNQEAAAARLPSDTRATGRKAAACPAGLRSPRDATRRTVLPKAADGSAEDCVPPARAPSARGRQHSRVQPGAPAPPLSAAAGAGGRRTPGTMRGSRRPAPSWPGRSSRSKRERAERDGLSSRQRHIARQKAPGPVVFFFFN